MAVASLVMFVDWQKRFGAIAGVERWGVEG
jgi:hypothetical protein